MMRSPPLPIRLSVKLKRLKDVDVHVRTAVLRRMRKVPAETRYKLCSVGATQEPCGRGKCCTYCKVIGRATVVRRARQGAGTRCCKVQLKTRATRRVHGSMYGFIRYGMCRARDKSNGNDNDNDFRTKRTMRTANWRFLQ